MTILINTLSFFKKEDGFIYDAFKYLSRSYPGHQFIFLTDSHLPSLNGAENIKSISFGSIPKNHLWAKIWLRMKIKKVIKQQKADFLFSNELIITGTNIPQVLIYPDLAYLYQPAIISRSQKKYFEKRMSRFLEKAHCIIVNSLFEKGILEAKYPSSAEKIKVIYENFYTESHVIDFEERESIKEKYAGGYEYFTYSGVIGDQQNLLNLLKAFSLFKKRQRSNMRLVITGKEGPGFRELEQSIDTYKFKNEVTILPGLPQADEQKLVAASYAMILPQAWLNSSNILLQALFSGVPAIISSKGISAEIAGEAALYADVDNIKDISEKMMDIFRNEKLRNQLIENGKQQMEKFNKPESFDALLQILKTPDK